MPMKPISFKSFSLNIITSRKHYCFFLPDCKCDSLGLETSPSLFQKECDLLSCKKGEISTAHTQANVTNALDPEAVVNDSKNIYGGYYVGGGGGGAVEHQDQTFYLKGCCTDSIAIRVILVKRNIDYGGMIFLLSGCIPPINSAAAFFDCWTTLVKMRGKELDSNGLIQAAAFLDMEALFNKYNLTVEKPG
ncbi:hypothetical protein OIU74_010010 [Salix koriyanagi]|uniref:Uncharacterized protein n=1 Tax=Salix koriyanagi TaxID=2511006 RepID=A0A9Q0QLP1_9ROSI|nr:hypothetical protein OIU74_010010 [Salix koriyanagi]